MLRKVKLVLRSVLAMRPVLRRVYGRAWLLALARCALHSRKLLQKTRWASRGDAEARYVRTLALLPAICIDMRTRLGERAQEAVREVVTAIVEAENEHIAHEAGLFEIPDERERWYAYFDRTIVHGAGAFNENECVSLEPDRFHYRVFRCVFADLARETGVPEFARIMCDLDIPFHNRVFPSYQFHRHGSPQNTLAYGHPHCEYVWDRRSETATVACEPPNDAAPAERNPHLAAPEPADEVSH
jgi:L-2-amino-thiazoline-4-carboxylic acid hydrolase